VRPSREEIARLIDPEAWTEKSPTAMPCTQPGYGWAGWLSYKRHGARLKADAILALFETSGDANARGLLVSEARRLLRRYSTSEDGWRDLARRTLDYLGEDYEFPPEDDSETSGRSPLANDGGAPVNTPPGRAGAEGSPP
jgi:hypothetical protein